MGVCHSVPAWESELVAGFKKLTIRIEYTRGEDGSPRLHMSISESEQLEKDKYPSAGGNGASSPRAPLMTLNGKLPEVAGAPSPARTSPNRPEPIKKRQSFSMAELPVAEFTSRSGARFSSDRSTNSSVMLGREGERSIKAGGWTPDGAALYAKDPSPAGRTMWHTMATEGGEAELNGGPHTHMPRSLSTQLVGPSDGHGRVYVYRGSVPGNPRVRHERASDLLGVISTTWRRPADARHTSQTHDAYNGPKQYKLRVRSEVFDGLNESDACLFLALATDQFWTAPQGAAVGYTEPRGTSMIYTPPTSPNRRPSWAPPPGPMKL